MMMNLPLAIIAFGGTFQAANDVAGIRDSESTKEQF